MTRRGPRGWKPSEVARYVGVSYDFINDLRKAGLMRFRAIGPRTHRASDGEVEFFYNHGKEGLKRRRLDEIRSAGA